ncbi:hypothetical protein LSTR_LSTR003166 [Laodelphax striatellus]|uniref:Uncharacterized protein n=1 Tax=Laodelphax striatellus TaxID=195883 RepID=A0A482WWR4_LAOST|nr:hypothetical protein LSTR_LSTR003166 [Laodelphax striatellus]
MLLETGAANLSAYSETTLWIVKRCLKLPEDRYPKCLMEELIKKRLFMYEDWRKLEESFGITLDGIRDGSLNTECVLTSIGRKLRVSRNSESIIKPTLLLQKPAQSLE